MPPARALRAERQVPAPHAALDPARRPAQRQHDRSDDRQREQDAEQHVAQHGDRGRDIAEQRAIRLHARDVDREQRRHKGQRPPSVARRARPLVRDDLLEQGHGFGTMAQAQIVDDRASGVIGHVNRRDGDRPGDAAHAQRRGDGDRPGRRHVARRQEQGGDRQIAHRGDAGDELFTTRGGAPRGGGVAEPVERERGGQEEEQRGARDEGRVDDGEPHQHGDEAARHGAAQGGGLGTADAVKDFKTAGEREQRADALQRLFGGAERGGQRDDAEAGHRHRQRADGRRPLAGAERPPAVQAPSQGCAPLMDAPTPPRSA